MDQVLNGSFYINGPPLYLEDEFPANFSLYGYITNQEYTFLGFPNSDQHFINCTNCNMSNLSTGVEVVERLFATVQLNDGMLQQNADSPAGNIDGQGQASQLIPSADAGPRTLASQPAALIGQPDRALLSTHGF